MVFIDKYLERIRKLAKGYEVEEVQTIIEETTSGTKKRIVRTKKHIPPNLQAIKYLMNSEIKEDNSDDLKLKELRWNDGDN